MRGCAVTAEWGEPLVQQQEQRPASPSAPAVLVLLAQDADHLLHAVGRVAELVALLLAALGARLAGFDAVRSGEYGGRVSAPLTTDSLLADERWFSLVSELMLEVIESANAAGLNLSTSLAGELIEKTKVMRELQEAQKKAEERRAREIAEKAEEETKERARIEKEAARKAKPVLLEPIISGILANRYK